jgi:2-succinyl-5-enolpyruvyl-6-hydroxy-3-cyclohexene-1-carboxylate synthase
VTASVSTPASFGANVDLFAILLDQLNWLGLRQVVLAPGSRSTPLAVALATSRMEVTVCLDERGAAFFAVGMTRRTRDPVMVVTTSGTASLELVPAVAEASLAGLPLLAVTADRPARLKGVSAPQTLDQLQALTGFVRRTLALELGDSLGRSDLASIARQLMLELLGAPDGPGPVHLNLGIEEPLLGVVRPGNDPQRPTESSLPTSARRSIVTRPALAPLEADVTAQIFDPRRRGWILLGGVGDEGGGLAASKDRQPDSDQTSVALVALELSERLGWELIVDARSQLQTDHQPIIHLESVARGDIDLPEVAVVIGDFPLARSSMAALRAITTAGGEVITMNDRFVVRDPGRFVTGSYIVDVRATLRLAVARCERDYPGVNEVDVTALDVTEVSGEADRLGETVATRTPSSGLVELDRRIDSVIADYVSEHPDTEVAFARRLYGLLVGPESLFVSASMPIRYLDQFRGYHTDPPVVGMNRGANGIDGVIASYLGFAHAQPEELAVLLIGDLATLYDVGSLIHLPWPNKGLIVVLDNQGGLIFDQVPPAAMIPEAVQTSFFVTPPRVRPAEVLSGFGLEVLRPKRAEELDALIEKARSGAFVVAVVEGTRSMSDRSLSSLYARIDADRQQYRETNISRDQAHGEQ